MDSNYNLDNIISTEIKRLSDKYNKEYLDCNDIMKITGFGRDTVRDMMSKQDFPKFKAGKRKVVSLASFISWQITSEFRSDYGKNKKEK